MGENARCSEAMGENCHCSEEGMVESKRYVRAHVRTSEAEVVLDIALAHPSCFLDCKRSDFVDRLCGDQLACAVSVYEPVAPVALQ